MKNRYVIITPAHNEVGFIRQVLDSVTRQTITPALWVIADDDSNDGTDQAIKEYADRFPYIRYLHCNRDIVVSYYHRRTDVFNFAYDSVRDIEFDFLAALDADLTMPENYYECILREFERNPKLGVASGVYVNKINGRFEPIVRASQSVPGGLQMFRKECLDQIGPYQPLRYGGDDSLMNIKARRAGWQTYAFEQYKAVHLRPVGTRGHASMLKARYKQGLTDYGLGSHPYFMLVKTLRRCVVEKPYLFGSLARFSGYIKGVLSKEKRDVSKDIIRFYQKEQLSRVIPYLYNRNK